MEMGSFTRGCCFHLLAPLSRAMTGLPACLTTHLSPRERHEHRRTLIGRMLKHSLLIHAEGADTHFISMLLFNLTFEALPYRTMVSSVSRQVAQLAARIFRPQPRTFSVVNCISPASGLRSLTCLQKERSSVVSWVSGVRVLRSRSVAGRRGGMW